MPQLKIQLPWMDRLRALSLNECTLLGDTKPNTIYSAIHQNKEEIKKNGWKFKIGNGKDGKIYVCRIK